MSNIKAIIFDFDGVILESVKIKSEAFAKIYEAFGSDVLEKVLKHHLDNGGMSRFEKFRYYHRNFLGIELSNDEISVLANKFKELIFEKITSTPFVLGAFEFISNYYKKYDFYISSATPENELKVIMKIRNISRYFRMVNGSPTEKKDQVKNILNKNNYKMNEVVFIGDSINDKIAAFENKMLFIARIYDHSILDEEIYKIYDFRYFNNYLEENFNV